PAATHGFFFSPTQKCHPERSLRTRICESVGGVEGPLVAQADHGCRRSSPSASCKCLLIARWVKGLGVLRLRSRFAFAKQYFAQDDRGMGALALRQPHDLRTRRPGF